MKISLDDGITWIECATVRVIVPVELEELHFNFTHEGLITDVVTDNEIEASRSDMYSDVVTAVWDDYTLDSVTDTNQRIDP